MRVYIKTLKIKTLTLKIIEHSLSDAKLSHFFQINNFLIDKNYNYYK